MANRLILLRTRWDIGPLKLSMFRASSRDGGLNWNYLIFFRVWTWTFDLKFSLLLSTMSMWKLWECSGLSKKNLTDYNLIIMNVREKFVGKCTGNVEDMKYDEKNEQRETSKNKWYKIGPIKYFSNNFYEYRQKCQFLVYSMRMK